MKTISIIQARMGSTRLPGKVMLPLGGKHVLERMIKRINKSTTVDEVVVATSNKKADDIISQYVEQSEASVFRGSESDVLERMCQAADYYEADTVVRIAGDCPAVSPEIIDHATGLLQSKDVDYVSNKLTRTFPLGLDVEVFTMTSFVSVEQESTAPREREHVTARYRENPDEFSLHNFESDEIFDKQRYQDRSDIELVLDEAKDYFHLDRIFNGISMSNPEARSIIDYVDEYELMSEISTVKRKTKNDVEESSDSSREQ